MKVIYTLNPFKGRLIFFFYTTYFNCNTCTGIFKQNFVINNKNFRKNRYGVGITETQLPVPEKVKIKPY